MRMSCKRRKNTIAIKLKLKGREGKEKESR
jgi:hypothetical protein